MKKIMPIGACRVGRTTRRIEIGNKACPGVIEEHLYRRNGYRRVISHGVPESDRGLRKAYVEKA